MHSCMWAALDFNSNLDFFKLFGIPKPVNILIVVTCFCVACICLWKWLLSINVLTIELAAGSRTDPMIIITIALTPASHRQLHTAVLRHRGNDVRPDWVVLQGGSTEKVFNWIEFVFWSFEPDDRVSSSYTHVPIEFDTPYCGSYSPCSIRHLDCIIRVDHEERQYCIWLFRFRLKNGNYHHSKRIYHSLAAFHIVHRTTVDEWLDAFTTI